MSERKRCCCKCRRCIRIRDDKGNCTTTCEIDGHYIGYVECFEGWCRHWAKDKWQEGEEEMDNIALREILGEAIDKVRETRDVYVSIYICENNVGISVYPYDEEEVEE